MKPYGAIIGLVPLSFTFVKTFSIIESFLFWLRLTARWKGYIIFEIDYVELFHTKDEEMHMILKKIFAPAYDELNYFKVWWYII